MTQSTRTDTPASPPPTPTPKSTSARAAATVGLIAGVFSGLFVVLAFPPVGFFWASWAIGVPPTVLAWWLSERAMGGKRAHAAALLALGMGTLPSWLYLHAFMANVTSAGYPLHQLYMSVWVVLYTLLAARVFRRRSIPAWALGIALAVLWTGVEYLRAEVFLGGYGFFLAGHPTIDLWTVLPMANPASTLGLFFISFLTVLPAMGIVASWRARNPRAVLAALALTALGSFIGMLNAPKSYDIPVRLAMVQTNLPQDNKIGWATFERLRDLTRWLALSNDAAAFKPDLIAWPETMFPGEYLDASARRVQEREGIAYSVRVPEGLLNSAEPPPSRVPATYFAQRLLDLQRSLNIPMIVGGIGVENLRYSPRTNAQGQVVGVLPAIDAKYNSAFLIERGEVSSDRYDKVRLTSFGEMIPVAWRFPAVQQWLVNLGAQGLAFDLTPGARATKFAVPVTGGSKSINVITPICFEMTFPDTCRWLANQTQGQLIVNLSNDGWFGDKPVGRRAHLTVCRWRAAELGIPVARSVNTGISALIDHRGAVVKMGVDEKPGEPSERVEGVLTGVLTVSGETGRSTIYAKVGDVWGWVCLVGGGLVSLWPLRRKVPSADAAPSA